MHENAIALIVGAGHAGSEAAVSLRQNGYAGRILLAGSETHLPYHRPPLSKAYLQGIASAESLAIRPAAAYEKAGVELLPSHTVTCIDATNKTAEFSDGSSQSWNQLILATGSRPRLLPDNFIDGKPPVNLHYLRSLADADGLREHIQPGRRLVIIGGGYIGLEVAASAVKRGLSVTVLEAQPRLLARVTAPEVSAFYQRLHKNAGVDIRVDSQLEKILICEDGQAHAVLTTHGDRIEADVILVGIGAQPNVELAERAGLRINNGIVVDESTCATSAPDVYAIGDCSSRHSSMHGIQLRLESVPNAMEQARIAATAITGKSAPVTALPWFWSDQYEIKLQIAGLSHGHDQVAIRGNTNEDSFVAFYLRDGRIIAADCVNRTSEFAAARKLVQQRSTALTRRLSDANIALEDLLDVTT